MTNTGLSFDFISDDGFRSSLEADYREMTVCAEHQAWKAVHVLAGSIVEAVLVDYLVGRGHKKPDPLEMPFAQLITACKKDGALSQKTAELCGALKSYRNLIHAGRVKRLGEEADADGAAVAQSLVSIVVRAVAANQRENYGLTAQQIVNKFETDPSALGVAQHLLKDAPRKELERLLVTLVPDRYVELLDETDPGSAVLAGHAELFRAAFEQAPESVRKSAMARYVTVLKEEPGALVRVYEEQFFRGSDLAYVNDADRALVKDHLLSRLRDEPSDALLRASEGLSQFVGLGDVEVAAYIDPIVRARVYSLTGSKIGKQALGVLEREARLTTAEMDQVILKRLGAWERMFETKGDLSRLEMIRSMKTPFEFFVNLPPATGEEQ